MHSNKQNKIIKIRATLWGLSGTRGGMSGASLMVKVQKSCAKKQTKGQSCKVEKGSKITAHRAFVNFIKYVCVYVNITEK